MLNPQELQQLRDCFPFFAQSTTGNQLIYLDNAATTQKPLVVIKSISEQWKKGSANVHRSSHSLANQLTKAFEDAREVCRAFINARDCSEIVWTSGATEAINLVAKSWGMNNIAVGDQILVTEMEHHSNLIPWQQLCQLTGAELKIIPVLETTELDLEVLDELLNDQVKLLAITHVSNVLGTINPIKNIVSKCHQYDCKVLVDGAQAVAHLPVDVQQLDCDFYVFSGHKCFAPEGTGVLYAKKKILESMPPWKSGGEMVKSVQSTTASFQAAPLKFEAGTPNISAIIAMAVAIRFLEQQDRTACLQYEQDLLLMVYDKLININGLTVHSNLDSSTSIIALSVEGCHSMDIAALLDEQNIAIRSGHLCAMPLVTKLNANGILRASFCFYNSAEEVLQFVTALKQSVAMLRS